MSTSRTRTVFFEGGASNVDVDAEPDMMECDDDVIKVIRGVSTDVDMDIRLELTHEALQK